VQEIKNADQTTTTYLQISSNTVQQNIFFTHCKLIIDDEEIIACKLELFKNPNN
jgi:hypothetical protein